MMPLAELTRLATRLLEAVVTLTAELHAARAEMVLTRAALTSASETLQKSTEKLEETIRAAS